MSNSSKPNRSYSASDYKSADELFASIKDAFEKSNAPIDVSFSTLDAVEAFASSVLSKDGTQAQPESDYVGYPYSCKPSQVSMFYLNRLCSEIKALPDSFLPISICFQSIEEVKRFAIDYTKAMPLSQLKNFINHAETRKPREPEKDNSKLIRWCLIGGGIIVLAALILLLIPKKKQTIKVEGVNVEQQMNNSTKQSGINKSDIYGLWRMSTKSGNSELIEEVSFYQNGSGTLRTTYKEYTGGYTTNVRLGDAIDFKWELNGNTIIVIYDGERTPEFTYKGGQIVDSGGNVFSR